MGRRTVYYLVHFFSFLFKNKIHFKIQYFVEVFKIQIQFELRLSAICVHVRHFCYFIQMYPCFVSESYSRQFKSLMGLTASLLQFQ